MLARAARPALTGAAVATEAVIGRADAAEGYWRRAAEVNPASANHRRYLTGLLTKREAWPEERAECEAWIRLDPLSANARVARVQCLLAAGEKAEARAELHSVEALAPPNLVELRIRFERRLR